MVDTLITILPYAIGLLVMYLIFVKGGDPYNNDEDEEYVEYESLPQKSEYYKIYVSSEFQATPLSNRPRYSKDIFKDGSTVYITLLDGTRIVTDLKNVLIFSVDSADEVKQWENNT